MDIGVTITSAYKSFNFATFTWAPLRSPYFSPSIWVYIHYSILNKLGNIITLPAKYLSIHLSP